MKSKHKRTQPAVGVAGEPRVEKNFAGHVLFFDSIAPSLHLNAEFSDASCKLDAAAPINSCLNVLMPSRWVDMAVDFHEGPAYHGITSNQTFFAGLPSERPQQESCTLKYRSSVLFSLTCLFLALFFFNDDRQRLSKSWSYLFSVCAGHVSWRDKSV